MSGGGDSTPGRDDQSVNDVPCSRCSAGSPC